MEQPLNEEQFRDGALELALMQLAPLFVEFQGSSGRGVRFDTWKTHQLRKQVAEALGAFIDRASVEALPKEYRNLMPSVCAGERKKHENRFPASLYGDGLCAKYAATQERPHAETTIGMSAMTKLPTHYHEWRADQQTSPSRRGSATVNLGPRRTGRH